MSDPVVSVLLPVYNVAPFLAPALDSIRAQTMTDFELIAVDDGSRDASLAILQAYAQRDARIRVLSRPNTGIVGALNDGLALARGEFVARMDGDDIAAPQRLALQVAFLKAHPQCVAVSALALLTDPEGLPIDQTRSPTDHEAIDACLLRGEGAAFLHPASMIRRLDLEAVGRYRAEFQLAEDLDLFLRLAERGRLANLPVVLHEWRRHLGATGSAQAAKQVKIMAAVRRAAYQRRGMPIPSDGLLGPPAALTPWAVRMSWAHTAYHAGHLPTARKHVLVALRARPWSFEAQGLLARVYWRQSRTFRYAWRHRGHVLAGLLRRAPGALWQRGGAGTQGRRESRR